jgi:CheY-like chemotaxis protein
VLLVDDDRLVLTSTAAMLEDLGHVVIEAESGAAALAVLRQGTPVDMVLADHGMPGMTGIELAQALRRTRPALPVILATGYGELPDGAPPGLVILSKPCTQAALAAAMQAARRQAG